MVKGFPFWEPFLSLHIEIGSKVYIRFLGLV